MRFARAVRFGFLRAPRSTVVQPGSVHGGLTDDPAGELHQLLAGEIHEGDQVIIGAGRAAPAP